MNSPPPIRLAIVGLGAIFDHQQAALDCLPGYELVAACDLNPDAGRKAPGIPFFTSLDELLLCTPDALLISAPPKEHYTIGRRALEAGVNVLLEKPACERMAQFQELTRLAEERGLLLDIAVHAAWAPEMLRFAELMQQQDFRAPLGPITAVKAHFYDPYMQQGTVLDQYAGLGGSWFDSGINGLSVLSRLVDLDTLRLDHCERTVLPEAAARGVREIQATAHFRFAVDEAPSAGWAMIDTNWTLERNHKRTEVFFHHSRTSYVLHHSEQRVYTMPPNGKPKLLLDASQGRGRLENHYIGLFSDYFLRYHARQTNLELASHIHNLFFQVYETNDSQARGDTPT